MYKLERKPVKVKIYNKTRQFVLKEFIVVVKSLRDIPNLIREFLTLEYEFKEEYKYEIEDILHKKERDQIYEIYLTGERKCI